jgi:hypothetical protein
LCFDGELISMYVCMYYVILCPTQPTRMTELTDADLAAFSSITTDDDFADEILYQPQPPLYVNPVHLLPPPPQAQAKAPIFAPPVAAPITPPAAAFSQRRFEPPSWLRDDGHLQLVMHTENSSDMYKATISSLIDNTHLSSSEPRSEESGAAEYGKDMSLAR